MNKEKFIEEMKLKTKKLALDIIKIEKELTQTFVGNTVFRQILRSATSVACNYRAACRARSIKEFFAKLSIVVEEADETLFWLELIEEGKIMNQAKLDTLKEETLTILKILSKARKATGEKIQQK